MRIDKPPALHEMCNAIERRNTAQVVQIRPTSALLGHKRSSDRPALKPMSDLRSANRPRPQSATPSSRKAGKLRAEMPSSAVASKDNRKEASCSHLPLHTAVPDAAAAAIPSVSAQAGAPAAHSEQKSTALPQHASKTRAELFRIRSRVHQALRDRDVAGTDTAHVNTAPFLVRGSELGAYVDILTEHLTRKGWPSQDTDKIIRDLDTFFESADNEAVNLWTFGPTDKSVYESEPTDFADRQVGEKAAAALRLVSAKVEASHTRLTGLFRSLSDNIFVDGLAPKSTTLADKRRDSSLEAAVDELDLLNMDVSRLRATVDAEVGYLHSLKAIQIEEGADGCPSMQATIVKMHNRLELQTRELHDARSKRQKSDDIATIAVRDLRRQEADHSRSSGQIRDDLMCRGGELNNRIAKQRSTLLSLQNSLTELRGNMDDLKQTDPPAAPYQVALEVRTVMGTYEKRMADWHTKEQARVSQRLEQKRQVECERMTDRLDNLMSEYKHTKDELSNTITENESRIHQQNSQIQGLTGEVEDLTGERDMLNLKMQEKLRFLEGVQAQLRQAQGVEKGLREQVRDLSADNSDLSIRLEVCREDLVIGKEQIQTLSLDLADSEGKLALTISQLSVCQHNASEDHENLEHRIAFLEGRLSSAETALTESEDLQSAAVAVVQQQLDAALAELRQTQESVLQAEIALKAASDKSEGQKYSELKDSLTGALERPIVADAFIQCDLRLLLVEADRTDLVQRLDDLGGIMRKEVGSQVTETDLGIKAPRGDKGRRSSSKPNSGQASDDLLAAQGSPPSPKHLPADAVVLGAGHSSVTFAPKPIKQENADHVIEDGPVFWLDESDQPHGLGGSFMVGKRRAVVKPPAPMLPPRF